MRQRKLCCYVSVLALATTMFEISLTEVYTSSKKIEDMVVQEQQILRKLHEAVAETGNETASMLFSQFYKKRMLEAEDRRHNADRRENLSHPNGIYFCIKHFAAEYEKIRSVLGVRGKCKQLGNRYKIQPFERQAHRLHCIGITLSPSVAKWIGDAILNPAHRVRNTAAGDLASAALRWFSYKDNMPSRSVQAYLSSVADQKDVMGARLSFLRLQTVYNLTTSDIVQGNYFGRRGPELSQEDVLEIGQAALETEQVASAIDWLEQALKLDNKREPTAGFNPLHSEISLTGQIHALLGRAFHQQGNRQTATEMYRRAVNADPDNVNVKLLGRELESQPRRYPSQHVQSPLIDAFQRLCRLQNKLTKNTSDPRLMCTYREVILPYYRFKMEVISVSPYVALFIDVITDDEADGLKYFVTDKLSRGYVIRNGKASYQETRTSHVSFVTDRESPIANRLSKRVEAITYLDATHGDANMFYSSDPFQVVNYGLGGHYGVHLDSFDDDVVANNLHDVRFGVGGNRIATFLIYLSDVEMGGSTAFPVADIVISPVKKMAVFWYNYEPSGKRDFTTYHASCPVVFGHKWVTNKWIYLNPSMFRRRCGLTESATQLDIDQYMSHGWT